MTRRHEECSICQKRILSNIKKRTLSSPTIWEAVNLYAKKYNVQVKKSDYICTSCYPKFTMRYKRTNKLPNRLPSCKRPLKPLNKTIQDEGEDANESFEVHIESSKIYFEPSLFLDKVQDYPPDHESFAINSTNSDDPDSDSSSSNDSQSSTVFDENDPYFDNIQWRSREQHISDYEDDDMDQVENNNEDFRPIGASPQPHGTKMRLHFKSFPKNEHKCFICRVDTRNRFPRSALLDLWRKKSLYVPRDNRCCKDHMEDNLLKGEVLETLVNSTESVFVGSDEAERLILDLTDDTTGAKAQCDFEKNSRMDSQDYVTLLGVSKEHFNEIFNFCSSHLHDSVNRTKRNALAMFFMWMRLNLFQNVIGYFFGIRRDRRQQVVSETIKHVTAVLNKWFSPKYIGFNHKTRDQLLRDHHCGFAAKLCGVKDDEKKLILIADATYVYHQKPKNFKNQRQTYCDHKKRNLVKPMIIILPDGYIVTVEGPWFSDHNNNDASIMKIIMKEDDFQKLRCDGDVLVVDRGFRDNKEYVEGQNMKFMMPELLQRKQQQFTTEEANKSKIVTMQRWAIEACNARIKNIFPFFGSTVNIQHVRKLQELCKIACAVINMTRPPLFTETEDDSLRADRALARVNLSNQLQNRVETELAGKRACWKEISPLAITDFPRLQDSDMKIVTLGVYQTRLATEYSLQHGSEFESYKIFVHQVSNNLVRSRLESRMSAHQSHELWIEYDGTKTGAEGITGYYCKCKTGARTVGMCSHTASVIWYLGVACYDPSKIPKSKSLADTILDCAEFLRDLVGEEENIFPADEEADLDFVPASSNGSNQGPAGRVRGSRVGHGGRGGRGSSAGTEVRGGRGSRAGTEVRGGRGSRAGTGVRGGRGSSAGPGVRGGRGTGEGPASCEVRCGRGGRGSTVTAVPILEMEPGRGRQPVDACRSLRRSSRPRLPLINSAYVEISGDEVDEVETN